MNMNMLDVSKAGAAKSPTMAAIEKAAAELAAQGPLFSDIPKEEPLPGVTHYGRIFDQPAYTVEFLRRITAR